MNNTSNMTRRTFAAGLFGACGGFVLPVGAFDVGTRKPRLKMGILSDIHLRAAAPSRTEMFRKALAYYRDRGADAVLIAGDIADTGRISELKLCADAWYDVFPNDRAPDGRPVEKLFIYGNHCVCAWKWGKGYNDPKQPKEDRKEDAIGFGTNRAEAWQAIFHEEYKPIWMKSVRGYTVIGAHWTDSKEGIAIEAFMKEHAAEIDRTKPFFYTQHPHPYDTCFEKWAWGHDDGRSTRALAAFPNAVAFSGHSHYTLTDERTVWQGVFTSINTASLLDSSLDYALRENAASNRYGYTGEKRTRRMPCVPASRESKQGMFLTVYDDCMVLERRDFGLSMPLGDDWVLPLPVAEKKPFAYASRRVARKAPEFAPDAKVAVTARKTEKDGSLIEVSFPHAESTGKCRVFEYEVTATLLEDGVDLVQAQRRVIAADYNRPDIARYHRASQCVFANNDLPLKGTYVFSVRPIECFGHKGAAIISDKFKVM